MQEWMIAPTEGFLIQQQRQSKIIAEVATVLSPDHYLWAQLNISRDVACNLTPECFKKYQRGDTGVGSEDFSYELWKQYKQNPLIVR